MTPLWMSGIGRRRPLIVSTYPLAWAVGSTHFLKNSWMPGNRLLYVVDQLLVAAAKLSPSMRLARPNALTP